MKIKFTKSQWQRISELLGNIGILSISSVIIPALFDKQNYQDVILGLVIAIS